MRLAGRKVLVTGGTGFIGGRLVEKLVLEQQAHVRVLVRNFSHASRIARFPLEMVGGDITAVTSVDAAVNGCDVVFHCARGSSGSAEYRRQVTVGGTESIAQAALRHGVKQLVHVSTVSVYEPTADGDLDETAPKQPSGWAYADSKLAAEQLVLDYHRRHGLSVAVVQPTIVYGPFAGPWTLGPVKQLSSGQVALINDGTGCCNAVYIDDVVDGMILAAVNEQAVGETFLLSYAEPITWRDFFGAYERILGVTATVSMTVHEVEQALRRQEWGQSTFRQALFLLRDPRVRARMMQLPAVRRMYEFTRRLMPERLWRSMRSNVLGEGQTSNGKNGTMGEKPLHVPDRTRLALYRSRTRVRIDKARRLLGYEPRFSFEKGMHLTEQWLRFSRLV